MADRLDEIKREWKLACASSDMWGAILGGWRASREDIDWIISRAERCQELEAEEAGMADRLDDVKDRRIDFWGAPTYPNSRSYHEMVADVDWLISRAEKVPALEAEVARLKALPKPLTQAEWDARTARAKETAS